MVDDRKHFRLVQPVHPQKEIEEGGEARDGTSEQHSSGPKYSASFMQRPAPVRLFNEVIEGAHEENDVGRTIWSAQVAGVPDFGLHVGMRRASLFYVKRYRIDQMDPMAHICEPSRVSARPPTDIEDVEMSGW